MADDQSNPTTAINTRSGQVAGSDVERLCAEVRRRVTALYLEVNSDIAADVKKWVEYALDLLERTDGLCEDCDAHLFPIQSDDDAMLGPIDRWWRCGACINEAHGAPVENGRSDQ